MMVVVVVAAVPEGGKQKLFIFKCHTVPFDERRPYEAKCLRHPRAAPYSRFRHRPPQLATATRDSIGGFRDLAIQFVVSPP